MSLTDNNNLSSCEEEINLEKLIDFEDKQDALPEGWVLMKHENTLPFFYHGDTGIISWTKPYVRKYRLTTHTPPLSAFRSILKYHNNELEAGLLYLEDAIERRKQRNETMKAGKDALEQATREGKGELVSQLMEEQVQKLYQLESSKLSLSDALKKQLEKDQVQNMNEEEERPIKRSKTENSPVQNSASDAPSLTSSSSVPTDTSQLEVEESSVIGSIKILPPGVFEIQSYLLTLVASIVLLEKKRKKKSYEEYLEEGETESVHIVRGRKRHQGESEGSENANTVTPINSLKPDGKTPVSFLLEYCRSVIKSDPQYKITVQDNPSKPFLCVVYINGVEYGKGEFSNKRQAKQLSACRTLEMLLPGLYNSETIQLTPAGVLPPISNKNQVSITSAVNTTGQEGKTEIVDTTVPHFRDPDSLAIDDEEVLSILGPESRTPIQIVQEYCTRRGLSVTFTTEPVTDEERKQLTTQQNQRVLNKVVARLDKYETIGYAKTVKDAKQRSAQHLLKKLYPHLSYWSQLVNMYAQKQESIFNLNLLTKLKAEMLRKYGGDKGNSQDNTLSSDQTISWQQRDFEFYSQKLSKPHT